MRTYVEKLEHLPEYIWYSANTSIAWHAFKEWPADGARQEKLQPGIRIRAALLAMLLVVLTISLQPE